MNRLLGVKLVIIDIKNLTFAISKATSLQLHIQKMCRQRTLNISKPYSC